MSFMMGLMLGFIIAWILHQHLSRELVDSINKSVLNWSRKFVNTVADALKTKTPPRPPSAIARVQPSRPDDLKKVEGIGPKIAGLLNEDGILTYADLANADVDRLKRILKKAGSQYRIADPTTWPEQAALANKGDWDSFKALQDQLKGGRRTS